MTQRSRSTERGRFLLLLNGGIGDIALFTPALDALKRQYPEVPIDALVRNPVGARVLKFNPNAHNANGGKL